MVGTESTFDDRVAGAALEVWRQTRRMHYVTVTGHSMWPLIRDGDLLLVAYGDQSIGLGDVAVVYSDERLLVHRIIHIKGEGSEQVFITKGDNNCQSDPAIHLDQVMGRVLTIQRGERQLVLDEPPWLSVGRFVARSTPILGSVYCLVRTAVRKIRNVKVEPERREDFAQVETDVD